MTDEILVEIFHMGHLLLNEKAASHQFAKRKYKRAITTIPIPPNHCKNSSPN